jgi:hypothetical protein
MKRILFLTVIVLCFLADNLAAEPDPVDVKATKGRDVKEIFPFGMTNSRGDSAYCELESYENDSNKRPGQFIKGMEERKKFFNEDKFKEIIDSTNEGDKFDCSLPGYERYNKKNYNMKYCKLCKKGETVSDRVKVGGNGEFSPSTNGSKDKSASSKLPSEKDIETLDSVAETRNDINRNSLFDTSLLDRYGRWKVIGGLILLILIIVIIVKHIVSKGRQTTIVLPDMPEHDSDELSKLRKENQQLREQLMDEKQKQKEMVQEPMVKIEHFEKKSVPAFIGEGNVGHSGTEPLETQAIVQEKPREIFYFPTPIGNTFNIGWKTAKFIEDETLYRFERNSGEYSADVYVEVKESSVVQRFIYSPESQFGVCETVGLYNKNAKEIKMVNSGEAILDGDNWTVRKKVKIQYC